MSDALRSGTADDSDRDAAGTQPAGTESAVGGNAGGEDFETLRAENDRLKAAHEQALAEKGTLETLRRENQELRARAATPPNAGAAGFSGPQVGLQQVMAQRLMQHAAAAQADPANAQDSALLVGLAQHNQALAQQVAELRAMQSVPIEEQEKVQALQREYYQRGESISPATARKLLAAEGNAGTTTTKRQDAGATRADEEAARTRVATRTVGVSASDLPQKTMQQTEYMRQTSRMSVRDQHAFDRKLVEAGTVVLPEE